jgi:hypothetical protein
MAKYPAGARRVALCAWLTDNGINPSDVPQDAEVTIDRGPAGRFLRCEVYDRDPDGHLQADARGNRVATMVVNVPLKVEPPDWREPTTKPTRGELLASFERVHVLHRRNENTGTCEHCSTHDYPDYAVKWPCETVRALVGKDAS